jgi:hypothetical protein
MFFRQDTERVQNLREQTGDRRLASARIADDEVPARGYARQAALGPERLDPQQVGNESHFALHLGEADQAVELLQEIVE